jgi:hypothetical protein
MKHRISFDTLANIAVIAASAFVVTTYAHMWSVKGGEPNAPLAVGGYVAGDAAPAIAGVSYAAADRSLLLFLNSNCHYCTESVPFYKTLISKRNGGKGQVALIALSKETAEDLHDYLGAHHIAVDRVLSLQGRSDLKFMGTPTLILVNQMGRVQHVWTGALGPDQQREVLKAMES